nr:PREDICTED: poly [ADP-ribose] polymerase 14-like isoform X1 [Lepisosteus oculatus]
MAMKTYSLLLEGLPDDFGCVRSKLDLYFKNKRKSGGEVLEIRHHPEDRRAAVLVYLEEEVKNKVLERGTHRVDLKTWGTVELRVKPLPETGGDPGAPRLPRLEPERLQGRSAAVSRTESPGDEEQHSVCQAVTELNSLLLSSDSPIDEEILRLYFDQFSEDVEIDRLETNRWILRCVHKEDLEKVLARKEHAVSHTTVRAELYDEEAEERRLDPRRFVLRGFGETCPAGFVSVYLNSCSKSAAHSWELLPDGIAVTFHGGLDVKSFLKKCFTKHLQGNAITVTRLEVTDSVLVRGQMSAITEDTLQLYFSNPKRSKGGKIKSLRWCTKGESIIIAFEVAQDAQRVSEQPHVLCGVKMTAHLYYSSLGQALTGQTPPLPNLPSKITIPMDRQLLDYITSRAKCTEEFEKALGEVYAKVHFEGSPQPDRVVVEITAESNSLLLHRLAPSWERNARQTVHSLLDKYRIIQLKTETAVWEKIKTKCLSCISPDLNVHFESTTSSVVVLGLQEEVQSLQRKVELLMKEAGAELEVERNTVESRVMGDSEEELDFLCNLVFPKLVDIKLSKDQSALALCLKGHRDKVKQAESLVSETRQKLVAQTLNLSACQTEFLKSLDVKEFVRDHFARNGISATVLSHRSFQVLAEKKDIKRAVEKVQESVTEEIIRLTSDQAQVAKTEKWEQFLGELKAEVGGCVRIAQADMQISICGYANLVADAAKKLKGYLDNKMPATEVIPLNSAHEVEFADAYMKLPDNPEIKALAVTILPLRAPAAPCLKVTAAAEHIRGAVAAVRKQIAVVVSAKHVYGGAGESRALAKHEDSLRARAKELGCALWLSVQPASKPSSGPPCGVRIGGVVDLSVRQGAVAGQQADALVCPVNGSLAFDNPVARELLAAGGPRVKDPCDDLLKTRQALRAGEVVPSSPGNLPSKVLLLAVLPVWGKCNCAGVGGQPLESAFLHTAVLRCLQLAEERRCSSVALPALGCGGFGFPAAESARVVMGAVLAFCDREREAARHLRSVMVVESDIRNVEEFQSVAKAMGQTGRASMGKRAPSLPAISATLYRKSTLHPHLLSAAPSVSVGGVTVTLQKGDITRETVDVIVNSTNSSLDLNTGVSGAILKAAGKSVVEECAKLGAQPADGVVSTAAGQLRCRHIVHMVGPTTAAGIAASVESAAQECERRSAASVSFPAVGTGRGGIGHKESIEAMLKGLEQHFSKTGSTSIKSVRVIAFEQPVYDSFRDYFAQRGQKLPGNAKAGPQSPSAGAQSLSTQLSASQGHLNVTSTQFPSQVKVCNVTVEVKKGDITCESVRGIVNSTNKELNLMGGVSGAIFKAAGSSVIEECKAFGPQSEDGVVVTGGGALHCDLVLHMVGPKSPAAVRAQVERVLQECERRGVSTVSFPAVGTGRGGLQAGDVIAAMLQGFEDHLSRHSPSVLKLIYIVVAQDSILNDVLKGLKQWVLKTLVVSGALDSDSSESATEDEDDGSSPAVNSIEILIGRIKVRAVCGDITKERTDAIVSSTTTTLDLNTGVSAAILKAAGQSVVDECTALGTLPSDGFAFTGAGKLPAKHIVHMVGQTTESAITVSMCKVLKACEAKKIQSVSFPALGTGAGNLGAAQVASAMIDAVGLFALEHYKPSLNVIRLVIFQPGMMPEFEQVMKRFKKVTPQPKQHAHVNPSLRKAPAIVPHTSLGSLAELVTHPVATVEVCGASRQALAQVKRCLDELLAGECSSQEVDATHLDSLLEQEKQEIASLSRRHEVRLEVGAGKLTVTGKTDDVLTAVLEISGFFQKAKERENAAQDRERMKNIVRWEVVKSGTTTALDAHINYELELAYHKEKRHVYRSNAETFTVDFVSMQQTDSKGNVLKIKRTTLTDSETAIIELPVTWTDMKGKDMEIIMLSAKSEEFCKISKEFVISSKAAVQKSKKTVEVVKIERIQNREQWQRYAVRKQAVDRKYPTQANERILYHGTTQDICQKINRTGFNRSFCGRNATKFGQGTYFAKEAYYSCDDTYSNPDEQGYKYIYRARVLTGKLCQGHEDMKEPAPVNAGDPCSDLCDCAVDKMASPFIFVIFCDFGAYPEYLITFKVV